MMRKLSYLLLMLAACAALTAHAAGEQTLTFVKTDGSTIAFSTSGLVITYDDYAHAVVTNDETSATVDLIDVDYMCYGDVEPSVLKGDVNGDGEINIADINVIIGIVLGGMVDADTLSRADVKSDGEVNIADINAVIALILGQ